MNDSTNLSHPVTEPTEANDAVQEPSLADKVVWIIDDDILNAFVFSRSEEMKIFRDDDLISGKRAIDRGTLIALSNDPQWEPSDVKALCTEIIEQAGDVLAFGNPQLALRYLGSGAVVPDVIVYDLVYDYAMDHDDTKTYDALEKILCSCVAVVQIYARDPKTSKAKIDELLTRFPSRLQPPQEKDAVKADGLAKSIAGKLTTSLSTQLANNVRRSSFSAIERVLVHIDDLPLDKAIELLLKENKILIDNDLVELISIKLGEFLKSDTTILSSVRNFAERNDVPQDRINEFAGELVDLLAANVRGNIQYEKGLYKILQDACKRVKAAQQQCGDESLNRMIRNFFSFRLYDHPGDDLVRTGDIIMDTEDEDAEPHLFLVITPSCDLVRFKKKTRGTLTLIKMHPLVPGKGFDFVRLYGNVRIGKQIGASITARDLILLPSISISSSDRQIDYAIFIHEISNYSLSDDEKNSLNKEEPLSYSVLTKYHRKCRVSEPFCSGILNKIQDTLFRTGIPDMPEEEQKRLQKLENGQQQTGT